MGIVVAVVAVAVAAAAAAALPKVLNLCCRTPLEQVASIGFAALLRLPFISRFVAAYVP